MSDTVIALDLKFDYEWAKDNADRRKFYGSEIVKLIERCSKAEQENVALRAKIAKLEAPVSDEEWASTKNWPKGIWRDNMDALIAARGRQG